MRLFIAANFPAAVRDAIYADAAPLRAATTGVRWVSPAALHVTLKFLGEQDESVVVRLREALESVVPTHAAISARTTDVGAFPNFRRPRVVWVGMTSERALQSLASDIDTALTPLGIPREARAFRAHLTLGRVKGELGAAEATALAAAAKSCRGSRGLAVQTVDLMQSELGPAGSRYSVLAAVPLHPRGN
ncbi:MAG TPA: RNA 2',3'-cyclic phosphodiesterase [Gemmatimonadaceae bacterium]|nr:RNA 2',3'-cyclic phosphodiesterase [Gemmatimonadaceae bacterium]